MSLIYNVFSYMFGSKKKSSENIDDLPELVPLNSALVNLFYCAKRDTFDNELFDYANCAAQESLLYTMKIIAYIRNVTGERHVGRRLLGWLQKYNEPQLIENIPLFVGKYGRYDDLVYLPKKSKAMFAYLKYLGEQLEADYLNMSNGRPVSLAAKWIPSETSAVNKKTALTFRLARSMKVPISVLRKKYITPLRSYIGILEQKMCANDWKNIDYATLPVEALYRHERAFERNDRERFEEYKRTRCPQKDKEPVFPHEIVSSYLIGKPQDESIESKWRDIKRLQKTVVLSDVSLSMTGMPMLISSTLGLMADRVLTFESSPQFVEMNGATLYENVQKIRDMPSEKSTNICGALKTILDNMKDAIPERLIIVSDMQLNKADTLYNENTHETMKKMFEDAGFKLPQIVFWNVNRNQLQFDNMYGVSIVSGFSVDVLKCLLDGNLPTPFNTMMNALSDAKFDNIKEVI